MGNSKQFGVFGLLRKSVGSVTYSKGKDGKGKTIQIVRAKATDVANPNTVNQILQRAKIMPAKRFYEAMSVILDHSWQGIEYGNASRIHFMSLALKQSGPFVPKSVTAVVPAAYPISDGQLASVVVQPTAIAESTAIQATTLTAEIVTALIAANIPEGAQLTVIAWYKDAANNYKYAYGRVINSVGNLFEWIGSTAANMAVAVKDGKIAITTANGQATIAVGAICSQLIDGKWQRSTQELVLTDDFSNGLYGSTAQALTIESYQEQTNGNAINSAWYLNLANGQPFPGQLNVEQHVLIDEDPTTYVDVPYGIIIGRVSDEYMLVNGNTPFIFTDDGTTTGKLKIISNGQVIDGTAEMTASALEFDFYRWNVMKWLDVYATQLGF